MLGVDKIECDQDINGINSLAAKWKALNMIEFYNFTIWITCKYTEAVQSVTLCATLDAHINLKKLNND